MKYTNPLFKGYEGSGSPVGQPDPYMICEGGKYYTYATNKNGVILYSSGNFSDWRYDGYCLTVPGQKEFWAPCVIKLEGKFFMYYSSVPEGTDDMHRQRIKVAVADKPEGPFRYIKDILPPFTIDPHVVANDNGELFMFYCVNDYDAERAGTYIVADKMLDPLNMEGKPAAAVRPSLDEEIFERDRFKKGQHWHTIEGAFYFKHDGFHYLMYSGSAYTNDSYFIGYATAKGGEQDLRKLDFRKQPDDNTYMPLMQRNALIEGTGHNSVINIDGQFYIIYHGRDVNAPKDGDRRVFRADKLNVKSGKLSVESV